MTTAPVSLNPTRDYLPVLDGLRAISILFVVIRHFEITRLVSANLGVTVFFFISGFIITRLMLLELKTTDTLNVGAFYWRRFIRLIPALVCMTAGVVGLAIAFGKLVDWGQVSAGIFYYMNYYSIFLRDSGQGYALPLNPLWSLAVEEHFYLVFPLMFIALAKHPSRFIKVLIGLLVAISIWRVVNIYLLGFTPKYNYFASESRMGTILFGCLLALIAAQAADGHEKAKALITRLSSPWVFIIGGVLLYATLMIPGEPLRHSVRYTAQGILLFATMTSVLFGLRNGRLRALLSLTPFVTLGRISYSLYLWHLPVFFFLPEVLPHTTPGFAWIAFGLSLVIAYASFNLLEAPLIRRFGPKRIR